MIKDTPQNIYIAPSDINDTAEEDIMMMLLFEGKAKEYMDDLLISYVRNLN